MGPGDFGGAVSVFFQGMSRLIFCRECGARTFAARTAFVAHQDVLLRNGGEACQSEVRRQVSSGIHGFA